MRRGSTEEKALQLKSQYIGDTDPDRIAEYVQKRGDAVDGAVAMVDREWAIPGPEREAETVTQPSPEPDGAGGPLANGWEADGWEAPEAGLEPATRSVSQPGAPTSDGAVETTTGPDVPPIERPTSDKAPPKPSPPKRHS
jgi:hypothetical protein